LYAKYGWTTEKKSSAAAENQKLDFCAATNQLLINEPSIKIDWIVAKKENVQPHIRTDPNILYNFMCELVMIDYVKLVPEFVFIPDKRSVKGHYFFDPAHATMPIHGLLKAVGLRYTMR
jgi:hypothetical protein